MSERKTGSCGCGAVRFTTSGPLRGVVYCHCSQCRKQSGHFFAATNVADSDIEIKGAENITWYSGSEVARRGFCRVCGSALFWKHDELDTISVLAGAFDTPSGLVADSHIFLADKGDYYEIDDGLPQFATSAPSVKVAGD
ncbi:GFA family protein [Pseudaminobacter soli (ex Li et al. 2025)]|uniref:Aldehyde-activating protein n=1 Tax=Pseudaminobacter soli (ex Li et al. 2025) TaxID=1295366 RepID=A0A2P7SN99_9HYPH|nr:GFA family protein [Mesorhizobium soli]PSJ63938.1 aldehyde-activating protein [Mesorhizobium soli]